MSIKLIVALDFDDQSKALHLVDQLDPHQLALKVGNEMFTRFGPAFVKALVKRDFKVFLDLKFHDIPNTVAQSCKAAADLGVWMMNLHACGGQDMMLAAQQALDGFGATKPLLIAVTVLTSFSEAKLAQLGIPSDLKSQVLLLAQLAFDSQLDGVVCSAQEAALIKENTKASFITVTPGIRLIGNNADDQSRIMTPQQALRSGSDYLVVGRPITKALHPAQVVNQILEDAHFRR